MKNMVFENYKNKHEGERVFIIANGPSLKDTDLDILENEVTIAMNRISLIYDKNPKWKPTYYLFSSTNVRPDKPWGAEWTSSVREAISKEETTSFVAYQFKNYIDPTNQFPKVKWFSSMTETKPTQEGILSDSSFSTDIVESIDKSGTTMNLALQLCYHMGFSEIVIVGADLGWSKDLGTKSDPNHFVESYRADIPKPEKVNHQMRNVHSLAKKRFSERGCGTKIYNASLSTVLDVYPIINYEKYVSKKEVLVEEDRVEKAKSFWDRPHQFQGDA